MMDAAFLDFAAELITDHGPFPHVLELGSRDINGSVRPIFHKSQQYVGVDRYPGPGVDVVANIHTLTWPVPKVPIFHFDCVVATSYFEHDTQFWLSLETVKHALAPNGWFLLTVPSPGWPVHNYPGDYYRFTEQAVREILMDGFVDVVIRNPVVPLKAGEPPCQINQNIGAWGRLPWGG